MCKLSCLRIDKFDTYRFRYVYTIPGIGQRSRLLVDSKYLHRIVIAARHKHIPAVGRECEIAWMSQSRGMAYMGKQSGGRINLKCGYTIMLLPKRCI